MIEVHDHDLGRRLCGRVVALEPLARVGDRRALAPVHGHHVAVRPEAVHLGVARVFRVGAPGHQVHELVVVVDPRPLVEALGRLHRQGMELEVHAQQLGDRAVATASSSRSSQKKLRARPVRPARSRTLPASSWPPWRRVPFSTGTVSPRPAAGGMRDRPVGVLRRTGPGSNAPGAAPVRRQRHPRHGVRQHAGRERPLEEAVGAVAGGHPGVAPARDPARRRRGRRPTSAAARPASRGSSPLPARAPRSGTHAGARAGPPRSRATEKPAPDFERAAAGHPPAGPRHEIVGEQRLHDRPAPVSPPRRRDARSAPSSARRAGLAPSHSPTAAVQAPPATATRGARHVAVSVHRDASTRRD